VSGRSIVKEQWFTLDVQPISSCVKLHATTTTTVLFKLYQNLFINVGCGVVKHIKLSITVTYGYHPDVWL